MLIHELETPCVIVDLDIMERNVERMADYCHEKAIHLRPHTKTHKIPELASLQVKKGSIGITTAKVGEAEVMFDHGISDILIAYPIVGDQKVQRLARLAKNACITVALDSEESMEDIALAQKQHGVWVGILVELDVGFGRCGVVDERAAVALAAKCVSLGLEFRGLMFYPGHLLVEAERQAKLREEINIRLDRVFDAFQRAGIPIAVVSGGSTPTAYMSHCFHGVTEIRPGIYIFNDRNMLGLGVTRIENCALSVLVSVVSKAVPGRIVVDGGSKTFSSDRFLAGNGQGFGLIREDLMAEFESMSEEHGHLAICKSEKRYRIGERLTIIPNHVCSTINLHDAIYGVRGETVESIWRVAARGKVK